MEKKASEKANAQERNWLKALQDSDEKAFEAIFHAYYTSLCKYAFGLLGDKEEAEELVQDFFCNFWEKRNKAIEIENLRFFFFRAIKNASLNRFEKLSVRQKHAQEIKTTENYLTRADNAAANLYKKELEKSLEEAIKKLPPQCKLIFSMNRFEGLKYQQIADQLNLSIKTIENQMGKALRLLRLELTDFLVTLICFYFL